MDLSGRDSFHYQCDINKLKQQIESLKAEISKCQNKISDLEFDVSSLKEDMNDVMATLTINRERIICREY